VHTQARWQSWAQCQRQAWYLDHEVSRDPGTLFDDHKLSWGKHVCLKSTVSWGKHVCVCVCVCVCLCVCSQEHSAKRQAWYLEPGAQFLEVNTRVCVYVCVCLCVCVCVLKSTGECYIRSWWQIYRPFRRWRSDAVTHSIFLVWCHEEIVDLRKRYV
jgi:hypothetical protein